MTKIIDISNAYVYNDSGTLITEEATARRGEIAHRDAARRLAPARGGYMGVQTMHADFTALWQEGALVHVVYRAADGEITERVVYVREVTPDGDGVIVYCLRRVCDGGKPGRKLLFRRMLGAMAWDGAGVANFAGLLIIPPAAMIAEFFAEWRMQGRAQGEVGRLVGAAVDALVAKGAAA